VSFDNEDELTMEHNNLFYACLSRAGRAALTELLLGKTMT